MYTAENLVLKETTLGIYAQHSKMMMMMMMIIMVMQIPFSAHPAPSRIEVKNKWM